MTDANFNNESKAVVRFIPSNNPAVSALEMMQVLGPGAVPRELTEVQPVLKETESAYVALKLAGSGTAENTTTSKLVFAGIVTSNCSEFIRKIGPTLLPASPRYLAALVISPATKGARNTAACMLEVPSVALLFDNKIVIQTGALVLFLNLWVL